MIYPLHLDLRGRRVVVVGGGAVGTRRVTDLLQAGAVVTVVAPEVTPVLHAHINRGELMWLARPYELGDLAGAWLVHIATDDVEVNEAVAHEATENRVWSVRADSHAESAAHRPAVASVDGVTVSVSARDPRRSKELRDQISDCLSSGDLAARRRRKREHGSVVLIGGGPGDVDLISVRGRKELFDADVIVYDRLGPIGLLNRVDSDVELIDAGKSPQRHALTQDEINAVIVEKALQGKKVVRLKGGDPFVLGRGSEEMLYCAEHGVPVEVIPGITSSISAPLAAGIPVTHRGVSTGFVVVSGHAIPDMKAIVETQLTVVVLMGVKTLPQLVTQFLEHGARAELPIAIVERAYADNQRTVTGTLSDIVETAQRVEVSNPAVIVIGEVVNVPAALTEFSVLS